MKNLKVPRKLKKAFKKAVKQKFPLWSGETFHIRLHSISTLDRHVKSKHAIKVGGKALTAYSQL